MRIDRVERQVRPASLEDGQQGDEHLGRPIHEHANARLRPDTEDQETVSQTVGEFVELPEGHLPVAEYQRDRFLCPRCLPFEESVDRPFVFHRTAIAFARDYPGAQ